MKHENWHDSRQSKIGRHPFAIQRMGDVFPYQKPAQHAAGPLRNTDTACDGETSSNTPPGFFSPDLLPLFPNDIPEQLAHLEAVLFVARDPLSSAKLGNLAGLPPGTKTKSLLRQLNERYDARQTAFRVVEVAGGYQLRTRPEFAPWLARMQEVPIAIRLSSPAMETLAVIAYCQPVQRSEIERIRGVQSGELIRQLLERGLVKSVGRSQELGRPFLYGTTKYFLQVFGLGSLDELPGIEPNIISTR